MVVGKISQQLTVCVYLITALWISTVFAHTTPTLPAGIDVTLELPQSEVGASDQILLTMVFRNTTERPIKVLPYDTGLDGGVTGEFLEILKGGTPISYSGRISKFAPPRESDFLTIAPGQSIRRTVNLEAAYTLADQGSYTIRYVAAEKPSNTVSLILREKRAAVLLRAKTGFNFCTTNQVNTIESDLVVAEQVARIAFDDLTEAPVAQRASAPRYVEWFGAYTPARYAEVEQTFEAVVNVLENDQSDYFCRTNSFADDPMFGCRPNEIGFVFANDAFNVNLCLFYFNLPQRIGNVGNDGRVATIVHELTHFNVTGNTLDTTFSTRNLVKGLARNNPDAAVNNAPNFEFFSENMPALSMPRPAPPPPPEPEPRPEPVANAFLPAIIALLNDSETQDEVPETSDLVFTDSENRAIPTNDAVTGIVATITPTDTRTVAGLKVRLDIDHGAVGELEVLLSAGGTTVILLDEPDQFGESLSFACQGNNIANILSDTATLGVQSACLNQTPAYTAGLELQPASNLSAFDGLSINNPWTLQVIDRNAQPNSQTGTLKSWQLIFPIAPSRLSN